MIVWMPTWMIFTCIYSREPTTWCGTANQLPRLNFIPKVLETLIKSIAVSFITNFLFRTQFPCFSPRFQLHYSRTNEISSLYFVQHSKRGGLLWYHQRLHRWGCCSCCSSLLTQPLVSRVEMCVYEWHTCDVSVWLMGGRDGIKTHRTRGDGKHDLLIKMCWELVVLCLIVMESMVYLLKCCIVFYISLMRNLTIFSRNPFDQYFDCTFRSKSHSYSWRSKTVI